MARLPVGEGISADDLLAVENDQTAPAKFCEQRPDGRPAEFGALRKRAPAWGSSALGIELNQRDAHAVRRCIIAAPALEHMVGADHGQQRVPDYRRRDDRPVGKRHTRPHGKARRCRGHRNDSLVPGGGCAAIVYGFMLGRQRLVAAGGILGALAASSCCIIRLVLFSLGIGGESPT